MLASERASKCSEEGLPSVPATALVSRRGTRVVLPDGTPPETVVEGGRPGRAMTGSLRHPRSRVLLSRLFVVLISWSGSGR